VACACMSACGPSRAVWTATGPEPPVVAAPSDAPISPVETAPPSSTQPTSDFPRVQVTPHLVVARRDPAPRPRPRDDTLFTIDVPRLGLVAGVHEGQSLAVLGRGPGHLPGSALPGEVGNVVIPGHRTVAPHPFLDIDRLQNGDEIVLSAADQRFVYTVTGTAVVSPDDTSVTDPTSTPMLTLYACHPKGSDRQRYVVFARLATSNGNSPPAPPAPQPDGPSRDAAPPPPSCGLVPCLRR